MPFVKFKLSCLLLSLYWDNCGSCIYHDMDQPSFELNSIPHKLVVCLYLYLLHHLTNASTEASPHARLCNNALSLARFQHSLSFTEPLSLLPFSSSRKIATSVKCTIFWDISLKCMILCIEALAKNQDIPIGIPAHWTNFLLRILPQKFQRTASTRNTPCNLNSLQRINMWLFHHCKSTLYIMTFHFCSSPLY